MKCYIFIHSEDNGPCDTLIFNTYESAEDHLQLISDTIYQAIIPLKNSGEILDVIRDTISIREGGLLHSTTIQIHYHDGETRMMIFSIYERELQ